MNREWPIAALGLTATFYLDLLVHDGTKKELGARTDNQMTKATPSD